ncbi:MAG: methyltransferase [Roseococcus sp.]|nr:methyltransferase [Roseococcus sp.]
MPGSDPPGEDRLLGGRVRLAQPREGLRATTDPVLLAAFVPAQPGETVLEMGCGAGPAFLCLAARVPGIAVIAIERETELAALAARNAAANGVAADVRAADLRAPGPLPRCDHAFANPPWWAGGTPPPSARRAAATHEALPLAAWVAALAAPLRHLGTLSLVLPAARLADAAAALKAARCGALTLLPLWPRAGLAAKRILLQARRGGRGPDRVLPGLVLHDAQGGYTAEAEAVLRGAAALRS